MTAFVQSSVVYGHGAPHVWVQSPALQSAELFLLAGLAFLAIGSLVSTLLVRAVAARLSRWEPSARHRAYVFLAALPVLTATALLFSASLPSLISLVVPGLDHCAAHDDGHAHLCFVHLPTAGIGIAFVLGLVFVGSFVLLRAVFAAFSVLRALRGLSTLAKTGEERVDLGVTVIETAQPVCLAAGLFHPRVIVSRGLVEALGDEERAVVLAHEQAHVRRRDALVASIARALVVAHVPTTARWLLREIEIAAEQTCDEEAARAVGDRVAVASAILVVERATQQAASKPFGPLAFAFGERAAERRVEGLLAAPVAGRSLRGVTVCVGVAFLGVLGLASRLHHVTESFLSFVAQ